MTISRTALGLLLIAALSACGTEDSTPTDEAGKRAEPAGFTVTRDDGTIFELVTFQAICADLPEGDPDAGRVHAFASLDGAAVNLTGTEQTDGPVAMISVLDDVPDGTRLTLPVDEEYGEEETGFSFNIGDGGNEASSSDEEATGSVEIIHASCDPTPVLEVRIEATLGSETYDGETRTVKGYAELRATNESSPATPSSAAAFSPEETAYLKDSRPFGSSIEQPESPKGQEELLALGQDWCAWRQSPEYGSISDDQFFDEVMVAAADGKGIAAAADEHLCPA